MFSSPNQRFLPSRLSNLAVWLDAQATSTISASPGVYYSLSLLNSLSASKIATSLDGTTVAMVSNLSSIYVSSPGATNFQKINVSSGATAQFQFVAISPDAKFILISSLQGLWVGSNSPSWTFSNPLTVPGLQLGPCVVSLKGSQMAVITCKSGVPGGFNNYGILASTNKFATWTNIVGLYWGQLSFDAAISSTGKYSVFVQNYSSYFAYSRTGGLMFTPTASIPGPLLLTSNFFAGAIASTVLDYFTGVSMDSTGKYVYGCATSITTSNVGPDYNPWPPSWPYNTLITSSGGIYFNNSYGTGSWSRIEPPGTAKTWNAIRCSPDGSTVYAVNSSGLYVSSNFGSTWSSNSLPGGSQWGSSFPNVNPNNITFGTLAAAQGNVFLTTTSGLYTLEIAPPNFSWSDRSSNSNNFSNISGVSGIPSLSNYDYFTVTSGSAISNVSGGRKYVRFTTSATIEVGRLGFLCEYFAVGGGGAGGPARGNGGGGGAGGLQTNNATVYSVPSQYLPIPNLSANTTYSINLGAGGVGYTTLSYGNSGGSTIFSTGATVVVSASGGGGGGGAYSDGQNGGCGGGAGGNYQGVDNPGTGSQGYNGGFLGGGNNSGAGGGGGIDASGSAGYGPYGSGGNGGAGIVYNGSAYGGGGGGATYFGPYGSTGGSGGSAGGVIVGGSGAIGPQGVGATICGGNAVPNTGSGGGGAGGGATPGPGGSGSTGVFILSYPFPSLVPTVPTISATTTGQPSVYFPAGTQMTSVNVPLATTISSGILETIILETVITSGTKSITVPSSPPGNITVNFYITGGGGGGGGGYGINSSDFAGGGGGQGGTTVASLTVSSGTNITYSVLIGDGGSGGVGGGANGSNGSNSTLTLNGNAYIGGGGGGGTSGYYGPTSIPGGVGGSGMLVGYAGGSSLQAKSGRAGLGGGGAGGVRAGYGSGGGGGGGSGGGNGGGTIVTPYIDYFSGCNATINSGAGGGGGAGSSGTGDFSGTPTFNNGGSGGAGKLTITTERYTTVSTTSAPRSFIALYQCPTPTSAINIGIGSSVSGGAFGICQSNNALYSPYQYAIGDLSYSVTNYTGMNYAFASFNASTNIIAGIPGFNDLSGKAVAYQNNAVNTPFYIGSSLSSTLYTASGFHLCELIVTSNVLSSTDRENVEGYLAWKWGISAQLPSDHPYALFPPSGEQWISTVTPANICGLASWMDATFPGQLPTIVDRVSGSFSYSTSAPTLSTIRSIPYFNIPATISKNISCPTIGSALVVFYPQSNGTIVGWGGSSPTLTLTNLTTATYGTTTYTLTSAPQLMFIGWGDGNYYSSLNGGALTITANSFVSATTLTIGQQAGEVDMYNDFLEQPSRQILEGYLARKWNIIGNLPTTHPYYSTAPTLDTLKDVGALSIPTLFPTLTMWLDAADSTFTGTQWLDKSPIGDVFRANGTNPLPVFSTMKASGPSIPGVYFNGTASMLGTVPTGMANGIGTSFLVCSSGSMTVLAGGFTNGTQVVNSEQSFGFQSNLGQACCPIQGSTSIGNNSTALSGPGPNVYFASMSNGTGSAIINFQTSPGTTWQPSAFTSTTWCLGYSSPYPITQNFYLHEFVTFSTQLTTQERQVMEGYLAWKWGIQSMLPAGHPYKSARPYNP